MAPARPERDWLGAIQAAILRGELAQAQGLLGQALAEYPASIDLRRAQAGVFSRTGRSKDAEVWLRAILQQDPADAGSAFALAELLRYQNRPTAAAATLSSCLSSETNRHNAELAIRAIEFLDEIDHEGEAAAIAANAIEANPADARLHAYAGMLRIQLGDFEQARRHYRRALAHDERAWEWHVPIGLASSQRYEDARHPDFPLFDDGLQRPGLSGKARAELHFALGKGLDDLGDYGEAAKHFRQGNAIAHRLTRWSRKAWRRTIEARLAAAPVTTPVHPVPEFTPLFIVGMPRSGTTLLAGLLSRHPRVRNRGELPWIAQLAEKPELSGAPRQTELESAAAGYAARTRRDDSAGARWFIDKQPLNFRYLDLVLALFPDAKVIHCHRSRRDTALSLWMQCFLEDVQGYAYDFDDIAQVMRDEQRLMAHWHQRFPDSIQTVDYEQLVAAPAETIAALAAWIGLPALASTSSEASMPTGNAINTASLWQARQPVNMRSIGRWKHYAGQVPELLRFSE